MKRLGAILLVLLGAIGCTAESHSSYVGLWQTQGPPQKTLEIRKDGDSYLLVDLRETDMTGKRREPQALSKAGAQLAFNTGFGAAPLALSEDQKTLYFDKWTFARVPQQEASAVKQAIEAQHAQRKLNQEACAALGEEFERKGKEINRSNVPPSTKLAQGAELKKDVTARAEKIPDCKTILMLF